MDRSKGALPTHMAKSLYEPFHGGTARDVKFIALLLNKAKAKCVICLNL